MKVSKSQPTKKRLAVFKFASCDGCQLTLLSCEDELLELADAVEIAHFLEATSLIQEGPYDVTLVEGSITQPKDLEYIQQIRKQSRILVTIGACATSGGIQSLRNWSDHEDLKSSVYASPQYIQTLATSRPIAEYVQVDHELRGCPIDKRQLLGVLTALLDDRRPRTPQHSVCMECKRNGTVCLMVTRGLPCLGPVTQAGCGAICPAYDRGCYGCFGPVIQANCEGLSEQCLSAGATPQVMVNAFRNFNAGATLFCQESNRLENSTQIE